MKQFHYPQNTDSIEGLSRVQPFPACLPDSHDAAALVLETAVTGLVNPVAIDYHEPSDSLLASVNFPDGRPYNFVRIGRDGSLEPFSLLAGLTGAVEMVTVRSIRCGGLGGTGSKPFVPGDLFATAGDDGRIVRIGAGGNSINHGWAAVPGASNLDGPVSLYLDRTGEWDGHMIAAGADGRIWRIDGAGTGTLAADIKSRPSGLLTVPLDPERYGGLAGKLIAGNPDRGRLHAIDKGGSVRSWALHDEFGLRVDIEDIALAAAGENFHGIDFTAGTLTSSVGEDFFAPNGDIIVSDGLRPDGVSGLYRLRWDFNAIRPIAERIRAAGAIPGEWENIVFAPPAIDGTGRRSAEPTH